MPSPIAITAAPVSAAACSPGPAAEASAPTPASTWPRLGCQPVMALAGLPQPWLHCHSSKRASCGTVVALSLLPDWHAAPVRLPQQNPTVGLASTSCLGPSWVARLPQPHYHFWAADARPRYHQSCLAPAAFSCWPSCSGALSFSNDCGPARPRMLPNERVLIEGGAKST